MGCVRERGTGRESKYISHKTEIQAEKGLVWERGEEGVKMGTDT